MSFIKLPHLPERAGSVLVDPRIPPQAEEFLKKFNLQVYKAIKLDKIMVAVSAHPDLSITPIGGAVFVAAPSAWEYYSRLFLDLPVILKKGKTPVQGNYPNDVAYNVARIGNLAFHHTRYTDPVVAQCLREKGVTNVHVKQGYAKCSVAVVSERALITEDRVIAKKAREAGLDALQIQAGDVLLPGVNYGFLGGACGKLSRSVLAFCGQLSQHRDEKRIRWFCQSHGVQCVSLYDGPLLDIGSIIPITERE